MQVLQSRAVLKQLPGRDGLMIYSSLMKQLSPLLITKCQRCGNTINKVTSKMVLVHGHREGEQPTEKNAWYQHSYYCYDCQLKEGENVR